MESFPSTLTRRHRRIATGLVVLAVAFAAGAFAPRIVGVPFLQPFLGLATLALLGGAVVGGSSPEVRRSYRRGVGCVFGIVAGWWSLAFWIPDTFVPLLAVLVIWLLWATAEAAAGPSLPWSVGLTSTPPAGMVGWWLWAMGGFAFLRSVGADAMETPTVAVRLAGVVLLPVVVLGVPAGIVAFLLGRSIHRGDGLRPELGVPDRDTLLLVAVAVGMVLLGVTQADGI